MNRGRYRLVLNRSSGQWVPAPEWQTGRPKAGGRQRCGVLAPIVLALLLPCASAWGDRSLPVPAAAFVTHGQANAQVDGRTMTIQQQNEGSVRMQWNSFDVAAGHTVRFVQPSTTSRAINVVLPGGPTSDIYGSIQANGQVFLFNQAGVLFGPGARVDVGGLVGSSLVMNEALIERGLSSLGATGAAFEKDGVAGDITVMAGARIVAAQGGRILLAAPNIVNNGRLENTEGQTILAAGEKVYLADPLDSRLRGFLVEVDVGGKVTNEVAGQLLSARGNVTLVGNHVRHEGEIAATTSATLNGSVYLKARDSVVGKLVDPMFADIEALEEGDAPIPVGQNNGRVELAAGSRIDVTPETTSTQVLRDDATFLASQVNIYGRSITAEDSAPGGDGAKIIAPAGDVRLTARADSNQQTLPDAKDADSRIYLGRGSQIDVSGLEQVAVAADHDMVQVELRGNELKDSPVLRDPAYGRELYGKKIWIDTKQGTQLADVSDYFGAIERRVDEKSTIGGTVNLTSQGDVIANTGSQVDVSGGSVAYQAGYVTRSVLTPVSGPKVYAEDALGDRPYTGSVVSRSFSTVAREEGRDAGVVNVTAYGVALDGDIKGSRIVGVTQREESTRYSGPGRSEALAGPRAGALNLALLNGAGAAASQDVRFVNALSDRGLSVSGAMPVTLDLAASMFNAGGIGHFALSGARQVSLPAETALFLTPSGRVDEDGKLGGSTFSVAAASIALDGDLIAPGADVTFKTQDVTGTALDGVAFGLTVGSSAHLSVAGQWRNDRISGANGYLAYDGGTLTLASIGRLAVASGAGLDVSAGAWGDIGGGLTLGQAGDLTLGAGSLLGAYLELNGSVSGFGVTDGFAVSDGGRLDITAPRVKVVSGSTSRDGATLILGTGIFENGGFADFVINGTNGVDVGGSGEVVTVAPQPLARGLPANASRQASAADLSGLGTLVATDRSRRSATSVELNASSWTAGQVTVGRNARVEVDAGGRVALTGDAGIHVAGTLEARGGEIALQMSDVEFGDTFVGAQIHLAPSARLDVSGTSVVRTELGRTVGEVLDGGQIGIDARRGYLVAEAGAQLLADGASAELYHPSGPSGRSMLVRQDSAGGSIRMTAREGLYADATLSAGAGGASSIGGALTVGLDHGLVDWINVLGLPADEQAALSGARTLQLSGVGTGASASIGWGAAPDTVRYAGRAEFGVDAFANGGFSHLALQAIGRASSNGVIEIGESIAVAVPGALVLDAPNLVGRNGASGQFSAGNIVWRNAGSQTQNSPLPVQSAASDGALTLAANDIDVVGNVAASRFSTTFLDAQGDLRLSGAIYDVDPDSSVTTIKQRGSLVSAGEMTLRAGQISPASGADISIEVRNTPKGVLRTLWSGVEMRAPLSAGGQLSFAAPAVVHGGVVRASFGQIDFSADTVTQTTAGADPVRTPTPFVAASSASEASPGEVRLLAGSVVSTSAGGQTILHGETRVSGREWVTYAGGVPTELDGVPEAAVTVRAESIKADADSTIDLSGGGDLQAWEWIPGVGGSTDILADSSEQRFAILPALGVNGQPFDPAVVGGDSLGAIQTIELLGGGNGLAAGSYLLLPARYALMPGAYLVTLHQGDTSVPIGYSQLQPDGSLSVAARSGTKLAGGAVSTGPAFVVDVLDGAQVRARSEYLLSSASEYFASNDGATRTDDAGRLSLQVGKAFLFEAAVLAEKGAGRRGLQVDLTAERLAVLGRDAATQAGEVAVSLDLINGLGAESLLLGAVRGDMTAAGERLVLTDASVFAAASVRVDTRGSAALAAPEVILAARDDVRVSAGSEIVATGTAKAEALRISGQNADADGALLRLANTEVEAPVRETPDRVGGTLVIGADAKLSATNIVLDATRETLNEGAQLNLASGEGRLSLSGARISVGDTAGVTDGLVFNNDQLAALGSPVALTLKSYSSFDLYGDVDLGDSSLTRLVIDAAGVGGYDNTGLTQRIQADEVVFKDSGAIARSDTAFPSAPLGSGALQINANKVSFGDTPVAASGGATVKLRGFDTVQVFATESVEMAGSGSFAVDGNLNMSSPVLAGLSGADIALAATGALNLDGGLGVGVAGSVQGESGASVSLVGESVRINTRIALPSGRLNVAATGTPIMTAPDVGHVVVAENGWLDAKGTARTYLGKTVAAPAGVVSLSSTHGDVTLQNGSLIDVSGAADGHAGSVTLSAPEGQLAVAAGSLKASAASSDARGGDLTLDVRALPTIDLLASVSSDFTRQWSLRIREGDTRLGAGASLQSHSIRIAADAGSVRVDGTLDATGDKGGDIVVAARRADGYSGSGEGAGDVVIGATGALRAEATEYVASALGTDGEGGRVVLDASPRADGGTVAAPQGGRITIGQGATIKVGVATDTGGQTSAARSGEVILRAERLSSAGVGIDVLPGGAIDGARNVFIEATRVYGGASLSLSALHADNNAFMSAANLASMRAVLGGGVVYTIRPHAEIRTAGDFLVSGDQNFNALRYDGGATAASLMIRAGGDLTINGSLSDGFSTALTPGLLQTGSSGWNFALVGGADLGAADGLTVQPLVSLDANKGNVTLASGKFVRTGAGSIDVSAAKDIRLGSGSTIYSAGVKDNETDRAFTFATRVLNRNAEYSSDGGDVSLQAGGSVLAAPATQLISEWLYRQGGVDSNGRIPVASSATNLRNLTWYSRFDQFELGVGTFGGGDVTVVAGQDIDNLGAVAATSGRLYGAPGTTADLANLKVQGGGDVTMIAGGDIGSPVLYSGRGAISVNAGGAIGNARASSPMDAVIALGESSASISAVGNVAIQAVVTPTLSPQVNASGSDVERGGRISYFSTYAQDSALDVLSIGGGVQLANANPSGIGAPLIGAQPPLLPSSLMLVGMGGDVEIGSGMVLNPSNTNSLLIAAQQSVHVGASIKIPDVSADQVPNMLRPAVGENTDVRWVALRSTSTAGRAAHDEGLLASRTGDPVRIVAESGDVSGPPPGSELAVTLISPQQVWLDAGGDVRDFAIRAQHLSDADVTRIQAGGSVVFSPALSGSSLLPQDEGIVVGGEGRLEVIAGKDVELSNSLGVVTNGNADNPYLPEIGADIFVHAGAQETHYDALIALLRPTATGAFDVFDARAMATLDASSIDAALANYGELATLRAGERANIAAVVAVLDETVVAHMRERSGDPTLSDGAAMAAFGALPSDDRAAFYADQRPLVQDLLHAGLRYSGRLGDLLSDGVQGFQPGLDVMAATFPQAQEGSINVFYSQIRSEQNGNVDLLAPGGGVNAGVTGGGATDTPASRQGIFAIREGEITAALSGDFQVGPSRVFTLGGGDIQIWSSFGDIDAGKGAKTAVATPPPQVRIRGDVVVLDISNSIAGSGIGTLGDVPANVRLYAPSGVVNAGDAGIRSSGNVEIGAQQIIGADNISAGGTLSSSATPATPAAPVAAPATSTAADSVGAVNDLLENDPPAAGPSGDASLLTVEVLAMGEPCDNEARQRGECKE